jgi:hypothetical protein
MRCLCHRSGPTLAWLILALAAGCGKSGEEALMPVGGTVTYQGKPLPTGVVIFVPDRTKGNRTRHEPRGPILEDGTFEVETAGQLGAPPGWYRVKIHANEPQSTDPKKMYARTASLIPAKYGDINTSEIAVEVVQAPSAGAYDFLLK